MKESKVNCQLVRKVVTELNYSFTAFNYSELISCRFVSVLTFLGPISCCLLLLGCPLQKTTHYEEKDRNVSSKDVS